MTRRSLIALLAAFKKDQLQPVEDLLRQAAAQAKPRAAVLHVREGSSQYLQAFGEAKIDSRFLIASITKPMTATALMTLVDQGKLRLDDKVSRFYPKLHPAMQIRHLLTHSCGLPDMLPENTALRIQNAPLSEYVRIAQTTPMLFEPGQKMSYSSTGILLAYEITQMLSGKTMEQLVFAPLGMRSSTLGLGSLSLKDVVRSQTEYAPADLGSSADAKTWDWNSQYWRALGAPWGGVHATAADIATFLWDFLNPSGKVLREATAAQMIVNQNPSGMGPYGLGWAVGSRLGAGMAQHYFGHGGSTGTLCWADPKRKRSFVLLTSLPDVVARKAIIEPVSGRVAALESH
jgi:CubicO group peptidase (beta-lactamase class C family)